MFQVPSAMWPLWIMYISTLGCIAASMDRISSKCCSSVILRDGGANSGVMIQTWGVVWVGLESEGMGGAAGASQAAGETGA
jgi:hypothetical protein